MNLKNDVLEFLNTQKTTENSETISRAIDLVSKCNIALNDLRGVNKAFIISLLATKNEALSLLVDACDIVIEDEIEDLALLEEDDFEEGFFDDFEDEYS